MGYCQELPQNIQKRQQIERIIQQRKLYNLEEEFRFRKEQMIKAGLQGEVYKTLKTYGKIEKKIPKRVRKE